MKGESNILNIASVQTNLVWENAVANRQTIAVALNGIKYNPDVIVLPEAFSTGFSMNAKKVAESMDGETVKWMQILAKQYNCAICGSLFINENNKYYNRFVWVDELGNLQKYDKRHLLSMGEEHDNYMPGEEQVLINYKGWMIFPQICYDLRFPVWSRNTFGYDLLINVANWPAPRRKVWKTLLKARAIENQCYVVGVNRVGADGNHIGYSGDSMIVNYKGEIMNKADAEEGISNVQLDKEALQSFRSRFDTLKDADLFSIQF